SRNGMNCSQALRQSRMIAGYRWPHRSARSSSAAWAASALTAVQMGLRSRLRASQSRRGAGREGVGRRGGVAGWTMACGHTFSTTSGRPFSPMPLWMSSDRRRGLGGEQGVDLAGDVALKTADGFAASFAFGQTALQVVLGALVPAEPGQGDPVEGGVG